MSRTEHKSLQGVTEQAAEGSAETKDIQAGPSPKVEAEPTVQVKVINWTSGTTGSLFTPGEEVALPGELRAHLGPVYVKPVE
jgi:hypothetical protein